MRNAGITIHLGHGGLVCPSHKARSPFQAETGLKSDRPVQEESDSDSDGDAYDLFGDAQSHPQGADHNGNSFVVIIDISGVHTIAMQPCVCLNKLPLHLQFLDMALFPASFQRVKTAFTFKVLDDFLMENLECKTAANNYYSKLKRSTSNTCPQSVPVSKIIGYRDANTNIPFPYRTGTGN